MGAGAWTLAGRALAVAQALAALTVAVRLARGRRRLPPLAAPEFAPTAPAAADTAPRRTAPGGTRLVPVAGETWREDAVPSISVVIPARDEEARLSPCLTAVLADPSVGEVIVVDDESSDSTARLAAALGATVVRGRPLPAGWVGKQWALHQGLLRASHPIVVTLDADARPRPGLFAALAAALRERDLVSAGPRFVCDGAAEQALHAAFLATLVYRFGPIGPACPPPPHRAVANGQCLAFRREAMLRADGFTKVRRHMTDDVALARTLASQGWRVGFLDAGGLLEVDMHESAADVWRQWGRSLPLADVTGPLWQAADLAVVWLAAALPVLRLAAGRPTRLDLALLAGRVLLARALRASYARPGPGVVLSALLDPAAAVRLTQATLRPVRTWRNRAYDGGHRRGHGCEGTAEAAFGRSAAAATERRLPET
ncbi:glycosyl transferase [Sphaerisporangium melleum]|uniref:Glycosyl transferase n=1 Tax=Sphaerisporangium melleum TaxID=321316 RepID=A0A917RQK5_9ACTN|nr:glycosyltransferase [Sphaerisporangium melleum]GGL19766.1 glycosyl transferase [Sphaerisporangium melleum]GII74911.1 glycosyl transferase [Sphaerisporangium melleum]